MRITAAGLKESHPHDVTMTVEAPELRRPLACGSRARPRRDRHGPGGPAQLRPRAGRDRAVAAHAQFARRCPPPGSSTPTAFEIPLVTHPTDAVVSPASAVRIGQLGGLGRAQRRGAVGPARRRRRGARPGGRGRVATTRTRPWRLLQELHAVPIDTALLTEALKRVREAGVTVAARVSPQRARELTPDLLAAGVEVLVVQGTIISAEHVSARRAAQPQGLHRLARRPGRRGRAAATTAPPCTSCAPARPA